MEKNAVKKNVVKKSDVLKLFKVYMMQSYNKGLGQSQYHENSHDNSGGHADYHNDSHDNTPGNTYKMQMVTNGTNKHLN